VLRHGANTVSIFNYRLRENHIYHTYTDLNYWEVLLVKRCMLSALLSFMIPMIASHCSRSTSANQLLHASAAADLQIAILSVTCVLNLTTSIIVLWR